MEENKSIEIIDDNNNPKNQNQNKSNKNQNIIVNKNNKNLSNGINKNKNINKINLNDLNNQFNLNLYNNNIDKNCEKLYSNIQRYNNLNKVNIRKFNSRDKIIKNNSNLNKEKSKNELSSNEQKQKKTFNENSENKNDNEKDNIKQIIYKKNYNILKNNLNKSLKNKNKSENEINYKKPEIINKIISSDTYDLNYNEINNLKKIENNFDNISNKSEEKNLSSNALTLKDELVNFESDNDITLENNILKHSINFNNEVGRMLNNFNKDYKDICQKKISPNSPIIKQTIQEKNTQMISLEINTISQVKEKKFQSSYLNDERKNSKINRISKIIRNNNQIKKKISKENDINNYEFKGEIKYGKRNIKNNPNKIMSKKSKRNFDINKEELKINIDYDNRESNNKINFKEYKIRNKSIINGIPFFNLEQGNNLSNLESINNEKINYLNYTLNNRNNNTIDNNYVNFIKNQINSYSISFINPKNESNLINGRSLENVKNYDKIKFNNLFRNNSQNNDFKKKESISALENTLSDKNNITYKIKINNYIKNKMKNDKKILNEKMKSIEIISNNKLKRRIPSPHNKNNEKNQVLKKQKKSFNNNSKIKISNNFINNSLNINNNTINNKNYINNKGITKSNSNNFIECLLNVNNNLSYKYKEKDIVNKDDYIKNKFPIKKNLNYINCLNNNINYQKYKGSFKSNQRKLAIIENSNINNTNNYYNQASTSTSNDNKSIIYIEENFITSKSPKVKKNINFNYSANRYFMLNKNKRNININNFNNNENENNSSINNNTNINSYTTTDKNSFTQITNIKIKNKNAYNNQKENQLNYIIHPKKLFPNSNNNIQNSINKNNLKQNNDSGKNSNKEIINENNKINNNIFYNEINLNCEKTIYDLKDINKDKHLDKYLYDINNKKMTNNNINKKNKNNNINDIHSIKKDNVNFNSKNNRNNIYNLNKKLGNIISKKVLKKNDNNKINKNEDSLIDSQIPTVADENPKVNSLKIIKYNKSTYTNQLISQKLAKIFYIKKLKNRILSFLTRNDLYYLSLVNSFYNENLKLKIYKIIIKKILKNTKNIKNNIWNELINKSILYKNNNSIEKIYLTYLNFSNKYDEEITKDLSRTFPNNILFRKESQNSKKLFNVLKAYSNFNKKIGYAQGMNFIVAKLLIFYNNEIDSFVNLDALFTKLNFSDVIGITNNLEQKMLIIKFLLEKFCPKFIKFLEEKKINHEMFTVSWVITLFSKNFENNRILLIIWNFSIIFGWKFIYMFTISIINILQCKFLNMELYEFTQFMKEIFKKNYFEENFSLIIKKSFEYMKDWKKLSKELEKNLEIYKIKTDTESLTEIIKDSFEEDSIIQ